jgi:hypothetical protein
MNTLIVVVVVAMLVLLMLTLAVRIVRQYEQGGRSACWEPPRWPGSARCGMSRPVT